MVSRGPFKKMFFLEMLSSLRAATGSLGLLGGWRGDVDGPPMWRKAGAVDSGEEMWCLLAGQEFGPSSGATGQD